jgi:hypothetical protein
MTMRFPLTLRLNPFAPSLLDPCQSDPSNYYHPMGFAYYPDGAHDGKIELEPTVSWRDGAATRRAFVKSGARAIGDHGDGRRPVRR